MAVPQTLPSSQPRKTYIIVIAVLVVTGVIAYGMVYGLSYQSARGLTVEITRVVRSYSPGTFSSSLQFDVGVSVWSLTSFDTTISQVSFSLTVDNIPFASLQAEGSTWSRNQGIGYTLRFVTSDPEDISFLLPRNSHRVTVSISSLASAGIHSASVGASSSRSVTVSRVVDATINPDVVEECQTISRSVLVSLAGGASVKLSGSPDSLRVTIQDSSGTSVFSETAASFDSVIRLKPDTYTVEIENPGFFCTGADVQVSGSVEFWHEETTLT